MLAHIIGLIEIAIIVASLYAIWAYSRPEVEEPTTTQDFNHLMLEHIDLKLGKPELPLKKEYILHLQKIIVYFNVRAGHLTLKKERQLRRQYFEYKKWAKYKEVITKF